MGKQNVVSQHLQDCFVFLAITDDGFLKLARMIIKPSYFSSQVTEDIVRLCYAYFDQFQVAPQNHLDDEMLRFLGNKDSDKVRLYNTYLKRVCDMSPPNKKYVVSCFSKFVQARELEKVLIESAPLVERGNFEKVRQILQTALKAGFIKEEEGIRYPADWPPTYYNDVGFREIVCPTGFPILDERIKGLRRTQLTCVFAGYKVGKTWGCIHIATEGIKAGRKILEISHEASAEEVEMRHDMMFGSLTSNEVEEDVVFDLYDNNGRIIESVSEIRNSVFNAGVVKKVRQDVSKFGGETIIKKYPMGTCTVGEIERYLDYLETFKHYTPDLLISDYVEKMKLPDKEQNRDQINSTYINLKRIADERNIAVVTASQIKTKYLESSTISEAGAPSEDARKLGNIDLGLFFGCSQAQAEKNLMQAYVLVNRSGPQKFGCILNRNLKVGQMVLDCWPIRFNTEEGTSENND